MGHMLRRKNKHTNPYANTNSLDWIKYMTRSMAGTHSSWHVARFNPRWYKEQLWDVDGGVVPWLVGKQ
eukprot:2022089-Prorocentrum_lima.AAC.1